MWKAGCIVPIIQKFSTFGEYMEEILYAAVTVMVSNYVYFMGFFPSIIWLKHLHIEIYIVLFYTRGLVHEN